MGLIPLLTPNRGSRLLLLNLRLSPEPMSPELTSRRTNGLSLNRYFAKADGLHAGMPEVLLVVYGEAATHHFGCGGIGGVGNAKLIGFSRDPAAALNTLPERETLQPPPSQYALCWPLARIMSATFPDTVVGPHGLRYCFQA